jgi:hypothetical protein
VRPKQQSALIKPSLLLEATSHTAMGIAAGLAFAFLATHITALGTATLINYSPTLDVVMIAFGGTCAITFGVGARGRSRLLTRVDGKCLCDLIAAR